MASAGPSGAQGLLYAPSQPVLRDANMSESDDGIAFAIARRNRRSQSVVQEDNSPQHGSPAAAPATLQTQPTQQLLLSQIALTADGSPGSSLPSALLHGAQRELTDDEAAGPSRASSPEPQEESLLVQLLNTEYAEDLWNDLRGLHGVLGKIPNSCVVQRVAGCWVLPKGVNARWRQSHLSLDLTDPSLWYGMANEEVDRTHTAVITALFGKVENTLLSTECLRLSGSFTAPITDVHVRLLCRLLSRHGSDCRLQHLALTASPALSSQTLLYLSSSSPLCQTLRTLDLSHCDQLRCGPRDVYARDWWSRLLTRMAQLEMLDISFTGLNADGLKHVCVEVCRHKTLRCVRLGPPAEVPESQTQWEQQPPNVAGAVWSTAALSSLHCLMCSDAPTGRCSVACVEPVGVSQTQLSDLAEVSKGQFMVQGDRLVRRLRQSQASDGNQPSDVDAYTERDQEPRAAVEVPEWPAALASAVQCTVSEAEDQSDAEEPTQDNQGPAAGNRDADMHGGDDGLADLAYHAAQPRGNNTRERHRGGHDRHPGPGGKHRGAVGSGRDGKQATLTNVWRQPRSAAGFLDEFPADQSDHEGLDGFGAQTLGQGQGGGSGGGQRAGGFVRRQGGSRKHREGGSGGGRRRREGEGGQRKRRSRSTPLGGGGDNALFEFPGVGDDVDAVGGHWTQHDRARQARGEGQQRRHRHTASARQPSDQHPLQRGASGDSRQHQVFRRGGAGDMSGAESAGGEARRSNKRGQRRSVGGSGGGKPRVPREQWARAEPLRAGRADDCEDSDSDRGGGSAYEDDSSLDGFLQADDEISFDSQDEKAQDKRYQNMQRRIAQEGQLQGGRRRRRDVSSDTGTDHTGAVSDSAVSGTPESSGSDNDSGSGTSGSDSGGDSAGGGSRGRVRSGRAATQQAARSAGTSQLSLGGGPGRGTAGWSQHRKAATTSKKRITWERRVSVLPMSPLEGTDGEQPGTVHGGVVLDGSLEEEDGAPLTVRGRRKLDRVLDGSEPQDSGQAEQQEHQQPTGHDPRQAEAERAAEAERHVDNLFARYDALAAEHKSLQQTHKQLQQKVKDLKQHLDSALGADGDSAAALAEAQEELKQVAQRKTQAGRERTAVKLELDSIPFAWERRKGHSIGTKGALAMPLDISKRTTRAPTRYEDELAAKERAERRLRKRKAEEQAEKEALEAFAEQHHKRQQQAHKRRSSSGLGGREVSREVAPAAVAAVWSEDDEDDVPLHTLARRNRDTSNTARTTARADTPLAQGQHGTTLVAHAGPPDLAQEQARAQAAAQDPTQQAQAAAPVQPPVEQYSLTTSSPPHEPHRQRAMSLSPLSARAPDASPSPQLQPHSPATTPHEPPPTPAEDTHTMPLQPPTQLLPTLSLLPPTEALPGLSQLAAGHTQPVRGQHAHDMTAPSLATQQQGTAPPVTAATALAGSGGPLLHYQIAPVDEDPEDVPIPDSAEDSDGH